MTLTRDSFIARVVGYAGLCDFSHFLVVVDNFDLNFGGNFIACKGNIEEKGSFK